MLTERTTTLFVSIFYFQKCQTREFTTFPVNVPQVAGKVFTAVRFPSAMHHLGKRNEMDMLISCRFT